MKYYFLLALLVLVSACNQDCDCNPEPPEIKNIILMIGDGMGLAQIHAGMTANNGYLELSRASYISFSKTASASAFITDSGAGATAMSIGKKTFNGAVGVGADSLPYPTILEEAIGMGKATGLVATSEITHATPASFIAHQVNRRDYEAIALDFLKTPVDLLIGGGRNHFEVRSDNLNLSDSLRARGYRVLYDLDSVETLEDEVSKLAVFTSDTACPRYSQGRGPMLEDAAVAAIERLRKNEKGFFLMIEGSQIDWGGHRNDLDYVVEELLDFDRTVGKVLDFAAKDGKTLVIITADHETGGLSVGNGNPKTGQVEGSFSSNYHTSIMVPVFAYGPYAYYFMGIYENTAIHEKMRAIWNLDQKE